MDTNYLLQKLEPLIPEKVRHWQKVKDTADAETVSLIDRVVAETAYGLLGDFRKKILLSMPPQEKAKGTFNLGTVMYDKPRWPFGISSNELLQNLAIFGRSGAGKTNVVFHLIEQLSNKKIPWLFFDWKRTARHLIPSIKSKVNIITPGRSLSPLAFNPFIIPPGVEASVYITQLVDIMASAFTLGDGSRSVLQKSIAACYQSGKESPSIKDIIDELEKLPSKGRAGGWKVSALRALDSLAFGKVAGTTRASQEEHAKMLLQSQTIIELDSLADSTKQFLIPILSLWLYMVRLSSPAREKLSLVVILEEAHHVLYRNEQRSKESVMNRLLRQGRELGMSFCVVDQHPHLISAAALGNTFTSICLNLKDPSDITRAAGLSQVGELEKKYFSMLPVGQGIVKIQDRWIRPLLTQFPLVHVAKGAVTDEILKKYISGNLSQSSLRKIVRDHHSHDPQLGTADRYLTEEEFTFLHDVVNHAEDGVKQRYERLGLSGEKGNALKDRLVHRGWLIDELIHNGKSRTLRLKLSSRAEEVLGGDFQTIPTQTLSHEYWKRRYGMILNDRGYSVEFESKREGGWVDILAFKDGKRIGIEIETGKSDVVSNVKNCIQSKFDEIIVVAINEQAMRKVERDLAIAGLLIPNRVRLVLRGGWESRR